MDKIDCGFGVTFIKLKKVKENELE